MTLSVFWCGFLCVFLCLCVLCVCLFVFCEHLKSIYLTCRLANNAWKFGIGTVLVPELLAADKGLSSFNSYFSIEFYFFSIGAAFTKSKGFLVCWCIFSYLIFVFIFGDKSAKKILFLDETRKNAKWIRT